MTGFSRRQLLAVAGAGVVGMGARHCSVTRRADDLYVASAAALRRSNGASVGDLYAVQRELVRFATLAANSHNSQPWMFRIEERAIAILPDLKRRNPVVDPHDHHLQISLGCATENLVTAAAACGYAGIVEVEENAAGAIRIWLEPAGTVDSLAFRAITRRQSTRTPYTGHRVPSAQLLQLESAACGEKVEARMLTSRGDMEAVLEYVVEGNTSQLRDAAYLRELLSWMRFNETQALKTYDGVLSGASGSPSLPSTIGTLMFRLAMTPELENDRFASHVRSSAGVIAFTGADQSSASWIEVGRLSQRFALHATSLDIKQAFLNQPIEVPSVRTQFARYLGDADRPPDLLMRFGYGPTLPMSLRRSVDEVLI